MGSWGPAVSERLPLRLSPAVIEMCPDRTKRRLSNEGIWPLFSMAAYTGVPRVETQWWFAAWLHAKQQEKYVILTHLFFPIHFEGYS